MKIVHKSKLGLELIIPLALVLGFCSFMMIFEKSLTGMILMFVVDIYIVYTFWALRYEIDEKNLKIRCQFFVYKTIGINTVKKISETNSPLSSPALSLDRLEILYNKFDSVLISPKNKRDFIVYLTNLNPEIKVKLKK
ncbi:MAG TPA: PH domain-containing protein [Flavobacteriaceae bacterium]|nr:PH domain-containing protein [Flavobacteriaceae bacterium]